MGYLVYSPSARLVSRRATTTEEQGNVKTLYVTTRPDSINAQSRVVVLNNHDDSARLTPALARVAVRIVHGHDYCTAIVRDDKRTYRVTAHSTRLY